MIVVWDAGPSPPPAGQIWDWAGAVIIPEAETPGGTFRRRGDLSRAFRRPADDAARTFGRAGDTTRVFNGYIPR